MEFLVGLLQIYRLRYALDIEELVHIPVLANAVLEVLDPRPGESAIDCTAGRGGHSAMIARQVGTDGVVMCIDRDAANMRHACSRVEAEGARAIGIHGSFAGITRHAGELGRRCDMILADLGFSSTQMDDRERGFSFRGDAPLDMRFDQSQGFTAAELVASSSEEELADLIHRYGEEPLSRRIARKLVQVREHMPIQTTAEVARLVVEAYGQRAATSRMHPATRTFMALRIAVNDELGALERLLGSIRDAATRTDPDSWLHKRTSVAIITFHSLEDRIVKRAFADWTREGMAERLTGKPATADKEEQARNPRARSAKLRAVRMTPRNPG